MILPPGQMQLQDVELRKYYENGRQIGSGGLGRVYMVTRISDGCTLVAKEITYATLSDDAVNGLIKAVMEASTFDHPNIVRIHAILRDQKRQLISIVQSYLPGSNLSNVAKKYHLIKKRCPEQLVWSLIRQVAEALNYIHNHHYDFNRIYHRNIKGTNIILTPNGRVVLTDCCLVGHNLEGIYDPYRVISDAGYIAPEIAEYCPYKPSADVWSLGTCLYELCQAHKLFHTHTEATLLTEQRNLKRPIPIACSEELARFINKMLEPSPDDRPTIGAILSNLRVANAYLPENLDPSRLVRGEPVHSDTSADNCEEYYLVPVDILLDWDSKSSTAPVSKAVSQKTPRAHEEAPVATHSTCPPASASSTAPSADSHPETSSFAHESTSQTANLPPSCPSDAEPVSVPALNYQPPLIPEQDAAKPKQGSISARTETPLQSRLPVGVMPPKAYSMKLSPVTAPRDSMNNTSVSTNPSINIHHEVDAIVEDDDLAVAAPMMAKLESVAREVV
ncbi:Kinase, NEK [Giardia lamblia P15]|uniref:non-specific serine/threonine protein kinase n=1 Tax=Giardia intestinalis (strain P15) TaxID=658858 RepID=E1F873_GIAIA|nr:Kinase, NEK [Giardia lamblia P15]